MKTSDEVTGPINVGLPTECSILEFGETIVRITRSVLQDRISLKRDDPKQGGGYAAKRCVSGSRRAWRRRLPIFGQFASG